MQVEPCECRHICSCPSDGRLTYKRDEKYDCSRIDGTLSTYCFGFFKKALHCQVRQYSCYCRWCARGRYDKCTDINVVQHMPSKPLRPSHASYALWRSQGWRSVKQQIKSTPDRAVTRVAEQSVESAMKYVEGLPLGSVIPIRTNINGSATFWLASKQSEVTIAKANDVNTGIKKGEKIISIIWYDKLTDKKYMKLEDITHVSVASVLVTVSRITWNRTTQNRYYLGDYTARLLLDLVNSSSEI